ncbi:DUF932 domain-containing protein [Streptomyces sp. NPDC050204]|uniref:DUF932 domain-containing protein n=1 Tax=Streptomyces sp. NPDC050204 TaxID=3155514 RepID=UPI0034187358
MHGLEVHADGTASFVSARQDAWHELGTVTRDVLTAEEALEKAYLSGWNVRKVGGIHAYEMTPDGVTKIESENEYFTVRTNPKTRMAERLGTVGALYHPVQNEEHCELLNLLVEESGAHFETAGSLHGGKRVFVTMKLPEQIKIAEVDNLDLYIAGFNSHDGSSGFRFNISPTRVVCANTQQMALDDAVSHYTVRHTAGAMGKIAEARQTLNIAWEYAEAFEREAERLINETLTLGMFEKVCDAIWAPREPNPSTRTLNNHARRMNTLRHLFETADTQAIIRGTKWAGFQAAGEYLDHFAPATDTATRAHRILTSSRVAQMKQQAYELLLAA